MKKIKNKKKEYFCFEEYENEYFPKSSKDELLEISDPRLFGTKLAEESFKKVISKLSKK